MFVVYEFELLVRVWLVSITLALLVACFFGCVPWRMSGGKAKAKQPRDTAAEDASALLELQALHHTHREATRLFLMAVRQGATDAQIADALRQGLPHLTDPASLQDNRAGKKPEGAGTTEKGKQPAAQKMSTLTISQAMQTRPALIAADSFAAALGALPPDDWSRTWAACRTIMLRRTSKRVKEVLDKMRLPAVVRLSTSFWGDARKGTEKEKRQFVLRQLTAVTARCRITTLELRNCAITAPHAEWLAAVLAQCTALAHLDLCSNEMGYAGAVFLAGMLAQCTALAHLNLSGNNISAAGAGSLAGVLAQCPALAHLDLSCNEIQADGAESFAGVLGQCTALAHLNLSCNLIGDAGAARLAGVLAECAALVHLDLSWNGIETVGAESVAGVLAQCPALAHINFSHNAIGGDGVGSFAGVLGQLRALAYLNLRGNRIGDAGAERLAGVLPQCAALAHLNLSGNGIGNAGAESFAGVLAQCAALAHLELGSNHIGKAGAESVAGVLAQCPALAHLNLEWNGIDAVGKGSIRAFWPGQASGLLL